MIAFIVNDYGYKKIALWKLRAICDGTFHDVLTLKQSCNTVDIRLNKTDLLGSGPLDQYWKVLHFFTQGTPNWGAQRPQSKQRVRHDAVHVKDTSFNMCVSDPLFYNLSQTKVHMLLSPVSYLRFPEIIKINNMNNLEKAAFVNFTPQRVFCFNFIFYNE